MRGSAGGMREGGRDVVVIRGKERGEGGEIKNAKGRDEEGQ